MCYYGPKTGDDENERTQNIIFQHRNEFFARMRYLDELDGQIVYKIIDHVNLTSVGTIWREKQKKAKL